MTRLYYPPINEDFVSDDGRLTPTWYQWFEVLDHNLDVVNNKISIITDQIQASSLVLEAENTLTLAGFNWQDPASAGLVLTVDGDNYSFENITFATSDIPTGFVRFLDTDSTPDGWISMDEGTIGNAASAGTTRANADCSDLFEAMWDNSEDADCPVSSGRGASAAADFAANKNIQLPQIKSRGLGIGAASTNVAETDGVETETMTADMVPLHQHRFGAGEEPVGVGAGSPTWLASNPEDDGGGDGFYNVNGASDPATDLVGGSGTQNIMQPTSFMNCIIKL